MKIGKKISFLFLVVSTILMVITTLIFYIIARNILQEKILNHLIATVESRAQFIELILEGYKEDVLTLSVGVSFIDAMDVTKDYTQRIEQVNRRIKNTLQVHPAVSCIRVLKKNGTIIASSHNDAGVDKSIHEIYINGKSGTFIQDVHISEFTGGIVISIATPIFLKGEFAGVLVVDFNGKELFEITTNRLGLGKTGETYLVNENGIIISPSWFDETALLRQKVDSLNLRYCFEYAKGIEIDHEKIAIFTNYRGIDVLGTHTYIPDVKWCFLAEIDASEAFAPLRRLRWILIAILCFAPVIASIIGRIISRIITKPIDKLHKGTEIIAEGNLDYKVGTNAQDEIGQLSRAFDKMTESLMEVEAENKQAQKKMIEAIEIKSQFISMVSHELRTPLTAIKEGIGIVYDEVTGKLNKEQKDFLNIAKKNVERLARLINAVLDFQKLQAGKMTFKMEENDINDVVNEVSKEMEPLLKKKKLKLELNLGKDLPKAVFDRDRIIQVLTNLMHNALKFTEKGSIGITTQKEDKMIKVSVADTGFGIKKDDMEKLFHRFEQASKDSERKTGSTGLGLAISKEIINAHKGKIWVEAEFGKGTTFFFTISQL